MAIPVYEFPYYELIFYLGLSLFFGYGSSIILEKVGVPNVVVYLIVGFIVGNFFIPGLYETEELEYWYSVIEAIALGLIGFKIGTEVHLNKMKSEAFLLTMIIVGQVVVSFVLVFVGAMIWTGGQLIVSLIFGGLATASAPAATIEIIRKFKAEGELTQKIAWSLAIIDIAAVLIVELILVFASVTLLGGNFQILSFLTLIGKEIGFAVLLGLVLGFTIDLVIERLEEDLQMMEITLATLILGIGIAEIIHASIIITAITVGAVAVNREGDAYEESVNILEIVMSPILIIFFILVGSEIRIGLFAPGVFPIFAIIFFVLRVIGKIGGTYAGASIANGSENVKKYLGMGMIPQGGVVLGLITIADRILTETGRPDIGELIVITIILATLFSEALGSFGTVYALGKAGELDDGMVEDNMLASKAIEAAEETPGDSVKEENGFGRD